MKKISILILALLVAMAACKKVPEVNKEYVDVERDLITVGPTTATIQCDYEYIATLKKAFLYYGEGEDAVDMNVAEMSVVQKTLYVELTGLKENTTYSYYYEFVNGFNSMKSAVKAFKTEASSTTVTLPTVVTAEVTEITTNSAKGGGEVTNDGGTEVTERGICWSTNANPTLNDNHIASGAGTGTFTAAMDNLDSNTTYHVRAYATNEKGTAYGLDKEFTTIVGGGSGAPEGAINGLFTINENGDQVYFSQGNLQYQASTNTWRFAEHQWDFVGNATYGTVFENEVKCNNQQISSSYTGWIDLFGWGTSGYHNPSDPYNVNYQPWSISETYDTTMIYNFYGYGPSTNETSSNLTDGSANYDWGYYNSMSNGGNQNHQWRVLTGEEWYHVINNRNIISDIRYAKAQITIPDYGIINGVVLFPDNWSTSTYNPNCPNQSGVSFSSNVISLDQWNTLEDAGAIFFPAALGRRGTWMVSWNTFGGYWSATCFSYYGAYSIVFAEDAQEYTLDVLWHSDRCYGHSVRLVQDIVPQNKTK
ncbi:MAG: hypothetical protein II887_01970 [Bacteroidales bacterium]|nr:hypothetical protein [Bacteroidales bacterium]